MTADDPSSQSPPSRTSGREPEGIEPDEKAPHEKRASATTGRSGKWTPPPPEKLSELLPQYRIEKLIDQGGMGAVYQAVQLVLERPVAIKILPAEIANEEFIARFHREAQTLARLQHPGIVAIYDLGQTSEGHLYFVMELVDGANLSQIIHSGSLEPARALELTVQICEALHYAHGMGVVHRDIKPSNILIAKDGRAKLADFGLARPIHQDHGTLTVSNAAQGTPDYMAPEQREGRADQRTDIYALGVILYEMLTGKRPKGVFDPPSLKVQVDVRLDQVVIKALQQEPDRRYQHISDLKMDVENIRTTTLEPARSVERVEIRPDESALCATTLKQVFFGQLRNRTNLLITVLEAPVLAFVISLMLRFSEEEHYTFASAFHITTYLFLSLGAALFLGLTNSVEVVVRDRDMLHLESDPDLRASRYIFGKVASLAIFAFLQCGIYLLIGNWVLEIRDMFFVHFVWMYLTALSGVCMGLLVSVFVRDIRTALHVIPLLLLPQMILGVALIRYEMSHDPDLAYALRRWTFHGQDSAGAGSVGKLKIPFICQFAPLRWAYEAAIVSQAKLNPMTSTVEMLESHIQQILDLPRDKPITDTQRHDLEITKQALSVVSGLRFRNPEEISDHLKMIRNTVLTGKLKKEPLDSLLQSEQKGASAEEIYVNRKVLDLVTKAEMEREDYRRRTSPNVFFGTVKTIWHSRTVDKNGKLVAKPIQASTLWINFWVMVMSLVVMVGLLLVLLKRQLSRSLRRPRSDKMAVKPL